MTIVERMQMRTSVTLASVEIVPRIDSSAGFIKQPYPTRATSLDFGEFPTNIPPF